MTETNPTDSVSENPDPAVPAAPPVYPAVRAKFLCMRNDGGNIALQAVYTGSKENEQFFQATPAGQIHMSVVNPPAAAAFVEGKQYYVDFTEAPR